MRKLSVMVCLWLAAPLLIAAGGDAEYAGADGEAKQSCGGGSARVQGANNRLTFTGQCKSLIVEGADNVIYIELVKGSTISISGADNQIFWTGPKGIIPRMRVNGVDNRIARAR